MSEKSAQLDVTRLYQAAACIVYDFSQPRATKQTEGIPDLLVFCLRKGASWWHEVKTPQGLQSEAQVLFEERCVVTNQAYVCGGVEAAKTQLRAIGVLAAA